MCRKSVIVGLLVLVASGSSYADFTGYSWHGYDNRICYVNFDTLTEIPLEDSYIGGDLKSLKVSPLDGNVYAASNGNLYKVDTTSGATTNASRWRISTTTF